MTRTARPETLQKLPTASAVVVVFVLRMQIQARHPAFFSLFAYPFNQPLGQALTPRLGIHEDTGQPGSEIGSISEVIPRQCRTAEQSLTVEGNQA